jgi:hypothetical protein
MLKFQERSELDYYIFHFGITLSFLAIAMVTAIFFYFIVTTRFYIFSNNCLSDSLIQLFY